MFSLLPRCQGEWGSQDWVVDKAMADYAALPGVRFKAWFSDELHRQWGAVYLVDDPSVLRPDRLPRLPNGHTGPIGAQPTSIQWLELEAAPKGSMPSWAQACPCGTKKDDARSPG